MEDIDQPLSIYLVHLSRLTSLPSFLLRQPVLWPHGVLVEIPGVRVNQRNVVGHSRPRCKLILEVALQYVTVAQNYCYMALLAFFCGPLLAGRPRKTPGNGGGCLG